MSLRTSVIETRAICTTSGGARTRGHSRAVHTIAQLGPDLLKWVHQHGGYVHPSLRIQPSTTAVGLSLVPALPIPAATPLISLPPHLMLSLPSPHSANGPHSTLLSFTQRIPEEFWALRLGLKLLMERAKKDSFWWPYISNLPQCFNLPVFFSGQEIGSLQYAPVIHQVKRRCKALFNLATVIASETKKLSAEMHPFGGQEVDASALGWAMAAVSSRAFYVHSTSQVAGGDRKLLPLIDMCNHSFQPNARIVQQSKQNAFVTVIAEENLQSGLPVLLNYGSLDNDVLLLDYGFVVPHNPHDVVELKYDESFFDGVQSASGLKCSAFNSPALWQQKTLEKLALRGGTASLKVNIGGPKLLDGRLLAALRVLFTEESETILNSDLSRLQTWGLEAPLGHVIESNVLRTLITACALVLRHFPTTISEDERLLEEKDLQDTSRLAVQYRLAKKQTLVDAMKGFTQKLYQLRNGHHLEKVETIVNGIR